MRKDGDHFAQDQHSQEQQHQDNAGRYTGNWVGVLYLEIVVHLMGCALFGSVDEFWTHSCGQGWHWLSVFLRIHFCHIFSAAIDTSTFPCSVGIIWIGGVFYANNYDCVLTGCDQPNPDILEEGVNFQDIAKDPNLHF